MSFLFRSSKPKRTQEFDYLVCKYKYRITIHPDKIKILVILCVKLKHAYLAWAYCQSSKMKVKAVLSFITSMHGFSHKMPRYRLFRLQKCIVMWPPQNHFHFVWGIEGPCQPLTPTPPHPTDATDGVCKSQKQPLRQH